jgi:hypothetical protein
MSEQTVRAEHDFRGGALLYEGGTGYYKLHLLAQHIITPMCVGEAARVTMAQMRREGVERAATYMPAGETDGNNVPICLSQ